MGAIPRSHNDAQFMGCNWPLLFPWKFVLAWTKQYLRITTCLFMVLFGSLFLFRIWFWIRGSTHVCPPMIVHMLYEAYSQKFSNIHQTAAGFAFSFPYFISCWFWCERVFMSLAITILRHVMCTCTVAVSFKMVERPNRWISEVVDTSLQWCHSPPLAIHI